jgi:hypothetical protein
MVVTGAGSGGTGLHLYSVQGSQLMPVESGLLQHKSHVNSHAVNLWPQTVVPFLSPQLRGT